ncbi:adenylyl-sulfate kinase [Rosistilla ulvae]|uniref:Adenylyl-sulfate kinase n=1 Tax=Rosistilla ulvae TaxID=1930277 RepID=A0A517M4C4_9BACT|nr:adenylyl-sulfate kinase [Rosistilla ulvae]QDS89716.1 Adenylyl-sulfate kinase [Rosistilla ulvae]
MNESSSNQRPEVVWHDQSVSREDRERQLAQRGCVVWFTGLSGCGKSTIANAVDRKLSELGAVTTLLDGDNIRHHLCAGPDRLTAEHGPEFAERFGLGFGAIDREENIRRIGAVAELFASTGIITLTAFVSPYARDRQRVRQLIESVGRGGDFVEVFVDTPLETCEQRDPKGLYKKARAGEIQNFTGISDPYEAPPSPEIHLQTADKSPEALADEIVNYLKQNGMLIRT